MSDGKKMAFVLRLVEPHCEKPCLRGFPTRFDTNFAVQPQKMARGLKFRNLCSENKGADQLPGYCAADM